MSDQSGSNSPPGRRRSSIVDLFTGRSNAAPAAPSTSPPSAAVPSSPGVPQHTRGVSISALATGQTSPFNAFAKQRRASIATSNGSGSPEFRNSFGDEPAVIEDDEQSKSLGNTPSTPFARRVSFGAQALRDVRQAGSAGASGGGEGFNWSEAIRDPTKRAPSFSGNPFGSNMARPRATSMNAPEPPKEMPKPASPTTRMKKPDHLGERMLRGDFMMD